MKYSYTASVIVGSFLITMTSTVSYGQDIEALKRSHSDVMARLNPIMSAKVFPNLTGVGAPSASPMNQQEIVTFVEALELASQIQLALSPSEQPAYRAQQSDLAMCNESTWVRKKVYRRVYYRGCFGRCQSYCVASCEWVRVKSSPQKYEYKARDRQPLREAIEDVLNYFENRRSGQALPDTNADRIAALQANSIMLIVDPEFSAGEVVE